MATFLNGEDARTCGRGNAIITEEILLLNLYISDAVDNDLLTVIVNKLSIINVNATPITGTQITLGTTYYDVWQNITENTVLDNQMNEVIAYFKRNGFVISRSSTDGTNITWTIKW